MKPQASAISLGALSADFEMGKRTLFQYKEATPQGVLSEGLEELARRPHTHNGHDHFYETGEKVAVLEDLAARFKLKTQEIINKVTELQKEGTLTGVIDDRGKFIYISKQELEGVAKFIKQRGRVSIAELAESSNTLITLTPETSCAS
ncbi:DDRGK domain-containing protein 1-like [Panulirus ornatus]|uniref:DDRGK domain-containing protein 1-like n=1 Tax=Panulirus ornatus TaxID=150431 RepID=UPI003A85DE29